MKTTTRLRFEKVANAHGQYWRANATVSQIQQYMLDLRSDGLFKRADLGGSPEEGFEQAFSSLGYAHIKNVVPRLLDFMVGFQLVERNNDNTKAVGVFGFRVGDQWLYCPVFFLNGDLKGHELLFWKDQDIFLPLKENWVNYILGRKPHILGEASEKTPYQMGSLMPDLYTSNISPRNGMGKRGEEILKGGKGDGVLDSAFASSTLAHGVLKRASTRPTRLLPRRSPRIT